MANKQFVVIGMGRFGEAVAKALYNLNEDVLAIDEDESLVQDISDEVTHAVCMDATDEHALSTLGIRNFDVAIVSIGDNLQASIMITLILKEAGVKYIVAKGSNELHAKVLKKVGADRVVLPEKDMGIRVAHNLVSTNILDFVELSPDYAIIEINAPLEWHNKDILSINVRAKYGVNLIAIKKGDDINVSPVAKDVIKEGDILVIIGSSEDLAKLENTL